MDTKLGDSWTLNTPSLFDKNGTSFRGLALMDRVSYDLNQTAYDQIKPIRITTSFAGNHSLESNLKFNMELAFCLLQPLYHMLHFGMENRFINNSKRL